MLPRAKFHVCRRNVSPLRGEKPIFGLLSKNNTGMAALLVKTRNSPVDEIGERYSHIPITA